MELNTYVFNTPLYETTYWKAFLARDQLYLGRTMLIAKRDCEDLADLTQEEILDFFENVQKLENLYKKTFNATMFNWTCLMNDAYKDSQPKPQVHWHLRPRYNHPIEVEGVLFNDPNFGHHYIREPQDKRELEPELYAKIVTILQGNL